MVLSNGLGVKQVSTTKQNHVEHYIHNYITFAAVLPAARAFFAADNRGYRSCSLTAGEGLMCRPAGPSLSESESGSNTLEEASSASPIAFSTLARALWCCVRQARSSWGKGGRKERVRYNTNDHRGSSCNRRHVQYVTGYNDEPDATITGWFEGGEQRFGGRRESARNARYVPR